MQLGAKDRYPLCRVQRPEYDGHHLPLGDKVQVGRLEKLSRSVSSRGWEGCQLWQEWPWVVNLAKLTDFIFRFISILQEALMQRLPMAEQAYTEALAGPESLACEFWGPGPLFYLAFSGASSIFLSTLQYHISHQPQKAQLAFLHLISAVLPVVCLHASRCQECGRGPG